MPPIYISSPKQTDFIYDELYLIKLQTKAILYLRNRKHFPCFYRVIETRVEVWEKREIAWEHEHEVRVR